MADDDGKLVRNVREQFGSQNAFHAAFAEAWERLGGIDHLVKFGEENPKSFYSLMARMTPGLVPQNAINGDVNITVHHMLQPTALDASTKDVVDASYETLSDD